MMNIDIRKAIIGNLSTNNEEQLEQTIVESIENGEEKLLPGLGVLFELIWKHTEEHEKQKLIHSLKEGIIEAEIHPTS